MIAFGMGKINLLMCHIEVAAGDHGLFLIQLREIIRIAFIPFLAVAQSLEPVTCIGCVDIHKIEIIRLQDKESPLVIHRVRCSDPGNNLFPSSIVSGAPILGIIFSAFMSSL